MKVPSHVFLRWFTHVVYLQMQLFEISHTQHVYSFAGYYFQVYYIKPFL
jgi:hypothetical protein